jgi:hypothetical protein
MGGNIKRGRRFRTYNVGFADAVSSCHRRGWLTGNIHVREEESMRLLIDRYVSTIYVLSQSNLCERLFSLAKLANHVLSSAEYAPVS